MKPIFSAEDFIHNSHEPFIGSDAAVMANKKIEELINSWPVVYGYAEITDDTGFWGNKSDRFVTHQARLAFIEEIVKEPCVHEPIAGDWKVKNGQWLGRCSSCDVDLIAEWKEKK